MELLLALILLVIGYLLTGAVLYVAHVLQVAGIDWSEMRQWLIDWPQLWRRSR